MQQDARENYHIAMRTKIETPISILSAFALLTIAFMELSKYHAYKTAFLCCTLAILLFVHAYSNYAYQNQLQIRDRHINQLENERDAYLRLLTSDDHHAMNPVPLEIDSLPNLGVQGILYDIGGQKYLWDNAAHHYVRAQEYAQTITTQVQEQLQRARELVEHWNSQPSFTDHWIFDVRERRISEIPPLQHDYMLESSMPHAMLKSTEPDDIKTAPPPPIQEQKNQLKNLLSRRKKNV